MSMARATLSGTIVSDIEKRFTPNNTPVVNFTLLVGGGAGKNNQPFQVRITCWRNLAESVASQLQQGIDVTVEGRLQVNQFETQGGLTKRQFELDASSIFMGHLTPLAIGNQQGGGSFQPAAPQQPQAYTQPQQPQQQGYAQEQGYAQQQGYAQAPIPQQPVASYAQPTQTPVAAGDFVTEDDIPF
ncbi:MAG: single-stranded DNA-binding protein [Cyanobacteria bacterium HKST-UBA03]|nr:single-stranded DNA-binding protein [Cyanobacteria bacterium HKST-UBA05]MCA9842805.1 single-stranded DNA-binding protein [Cyanobacteria bacterium HKST-UBA03]